MDRIVDAGSNYACDLLRFIAAYGIEAEACIYSGSNRYALGVMFWVLAGSLAAALIAAYHRINSPF